MNDSLYEWNVKILKVDSESPLAEDLKKLSEKEGKAAHILLSFMFKVRMKKKKQSNCPLSKYELKTTDLMGRRSVLF